MDSRIQKILSDFRRRWNSNAIQEIDSIVNAADSDIRQGLLESIVACDARKRVENQLAVNSDDYIRFGSRAATIVGDVLGIDGEPATLLPGGIRDSASELNTIVPNEPASRNSSLPSDGNQFLHFELIEEIARGGMGVVFKARDTKLNRIVALKMIIAGKLASEEEKFRFNVEAEAAAKLDHPGITPIYEVGEHDDQPYFAMKLVEGGSLAECLNDYISQPSKAARLVADISHAIHHAHQRGTLHRDLKPNNILLDEQRNPLVTDFGLAKLAEQDTDVTRTGVMMGTPGFMPPEQVASSKDVTTAADIYSLGAILFATLTGRPPFVGETAMETVMQVVQQEPPKASSINSKIPFELDLIIEKCLDRNPERRYATAGALADDLENWLGGEPISVRAPSVASLTRQWVRQNIRLAMMSLLVGVVIAMIATPLCLIGFGQNRLPGAVYEQLPSAHSPPLAGIALGLPNLDQKVEFFFVIFAVFLVSSAGAVAVAWIKPQSMNDAMGIGIISGIAVGISLFLLLFGWLIGGSAAVSVTSSDLGMLAQSPDVMDGSFSSSDVIRWRYPELESVQSDSKMRDLLRQKVVEDTQLMIGLGNVFAAILTSMFFLPVVLAAGYYYRLQNKREISYQRVAGHLEFVTVAVLLSLALIWLLVTSFTAFLPAGSFRGPRPNILAMIFSTLLSGAAIWAVWNFKHWSVRLALTMTSVMFFAWFSSQVLVGGNLDRDIKSLLDSKDYQAVVRRLDWQTRQGGSWFGSGAAAVVMAAYSEDAVLHRQMHQKFQASYVAREDLFQPAGSTLFLETLLLTPQSKTYLPQLARLIEYVDKFANQKNYGTHSFQVKALAAYRAGELDAAKGFLDQVPIDDFARAFAEGIPITHNNFDDFKGLAIRSMVYFKLGERQKAFQDLRDLYRVMPRIRKWAKEELQTFGLGARLYYSLEVILNEAVDLLSGGGNREQWIEENLVVENGSN